MEIPPWLVRDRRFWSRSAAEIRTRAGVLPGETAFDPAPGPGLLAKELARSMPRFRFLVTGPVPPGASSNLETAGPSPWKPNLPEEGVAFVTGALTLDDWKERDLFRLFADLEKEIVKSGRVVLMARVPSPKAPDAPTAVADAVDAGMFEDIGYDRVEVQPLNYLQDGSQVGVVSARRPFPDEE